MDYETLTEKDFNNFNEDEIWGYILYYDIATEKELQLITNIIGYNKQALNNVIWARTGYQDAKQHFACEIQNDACYFD